MQQPAATDGRHHAGRARRHAARSGASRPSVGGSYLWQALKRPFQSASRSRRRPARQRTSGTPSASSRAPTELRGAFMKLAQMLSHAARSLPGRGARPCSRSCSRACRRCRGRACAACSRRGARRRRRRSASATFEHRGVRRRVARARCTAPSSATARPVVVKVQYPGVGATVQQDLKNVRALVQASHDARARRDAPGRRPRARSSASSRRGSARSSTTSARATNMRALPDAPRGRPAGDDPARPYREAQHERASSPWSASRAIRCRTSCSPASTRS